jgi:hypothetical protein
MIVEIALVALAVAEPTSGVSFKLTSGDLTQLPYVEAYTKCFDSAAIETKTASLEERKARYERCRAARASLIAQYNAERPSHGLQAKRGFEQSLNVIEKAYAEALAKPEQD